MYPYIYWACNPNQWIKNHNIQFTKIAPSFTLFSAFCFGLHFSSSTPMGDGDGSSFTSERGFVHLLFLLWFLQIRSKLRVWPPHRYQQISLFIIIRNCCVKFVIRRTWWWRQRPGNFHCGRVDRCLLVMITLTRINEDTSLLLFTVFWG